MSEIVRLEDHAELGLIRRNILGLNLFDYNHVTCPIEERPDIYFLIRLTESLPCAAQVGAMSLADRVDTPEEVFGLPDGATPYRLTQIGYHDGFYDLKGGLPFAMQKVEGEWEYTGPQYGDCFFKEVTPAFWRALRPDDNQEYIVRTSGLVLYINPISENATEEMVRLLSGPFVSPEVFLQSAMRLYSVVLAVGHDGQYLQAYAASAADFAILEPALSEAIRNVERSEWFRANKGRLAWSKDLDACLMLSAD